MAASRSVTRRAMIASVAVTALLLGLAGCANAPAAHRVSPNDHRRPADARTPAQTAPARDGTAVTPDVYGAGTSRHPADAIRTGRYQLVTLTPRAGQRDLLQQIVQIDLPPSLHVSVANGIEHALRGTGLHLCAHDASGNVFNEYLPGVHRQLGPTTLSDALQVLAGPAWRLHANFMTRTVCFNPRRAVRATQQPGRVASTHPTPSSATPGTTDSTD